MIPVDITELESIQKRLDEINNIPFENIDWVKNGERIFIEPTVKTYFKHTGLSNSSFITSEMYKEKNYG